MDNKYYGEIVYGVVIFGEFKHIHKSEKGIKIFATRNALKTVSCRIGSNVFPLAEKVKGKWVKINQK